MSKKECDCLSVCGDDSDISKGLAEPCNRHLLKLKAKEAAGQVAARPVPPKLAVLKLRKNGIELILQLDSDGKYFIVDEAV